jgi:hypothetical protein
MVRGVLQATSAIKGLAASNPNSRKALKTANALEVLMTRNLLSGVCHATSLPT